MFSKKKFYKTISSNITVKIVLLDEQSQLLLGEISACTNTSAGTESTNKSVLEKGKHRLVVQPFHLSAQKKRVQLLPREDEQLPRGKGEGRNQLNSGLINVLLCCSYSPVYIFFYGIIVYRNCVLQSAL